MGLGSFDSPWRELSVDVFALWWRKVTLSSYGKLGEVIQPQYAPRNLVGHATTFNVSEILKIIHHQTPEQ